MPPLRTAGFSANHPSFSRHRFNLEIPRFTLSLNLSKPIPSPIWASLPTPPMSGTPPPEAPSDPSQLAGRRRKREDSPPSTTTDAPRIPTVTGASPLSEHAGQWRGEHHRVERAAEPYSMTAAVATPWETQPAYSAGGALPASSYTVGSIPIGQTQVSPRSTRKTKAHVASACVNCKKKHLRCDETRPCRRCVQSGKEDSCKDVEHKKRGRPPLKPDETGTSRTPRSGTTWSAPSFAGAGRGQGLGGQPFGSGYPPLLPQPTPRPTLSYSSPYATPSIAQSSITASGQFSSPQRQSTYLAGPASIGSTPYTMAPQAQPQYGFALPGQAAGMMMPPPPTHQSYPGALFPRTPAPEGPTGLYGTSSLQLPPILPAPPATSAVDPSSSQHRSPFRQSDSLQESASSTSQRPSSGDSDGERDPKRPRMDIQGILGPRHD